MFKISFCKNNLMDLENECEVLQFILAKYFALNFTKRDILDGLAKQFGYTGWAHIRAVNKEQRFYLAFGLACFQHAKHISKGVSEELNLPQKTLNAALGLLNLAVSSKNRIYSLAPEVVEWEPEKVNSHNDETRLWITDDLNHPTLHLVGNPLAADLAGYNMNSTQLKQWLPDTAEWFSQKLAQGTFNIVEKGSMFQDSANHVKLDSEMVNPVYLKLRVGGTAKGEREIYTYLGDHEPSAESIIKNIHEVLLELEVELEPLVSESMYDGIDFTQSENEVIINILEKLEQLNDVTQVKLLFQPSLVRIVQPMFPNKYCDILDGQELHDCTFATQNDLLIDNFAFEPRPDHRKCPEEGPVEFWVKPGDTKAVINVYNQIFHDRQITFDNGLNRFLAVGAYQRFTEALFPESNS